MTLGASSFYSTYNKETIIVRMRAGSKGKVLRGCLIGGILILAGFLYFSFPLRKKGSKLYMKDVNFVKVVEPGSLLMRKSCTLDCLTQKPIFCKNGNYNLVRFSFNKTGSPEENKKRQESFENVYKSKAWIHNQAILDARYSEVQGSGVGATLEWAQEAISVLHSVINELKEQLGKETIRVLDVPCGDMVWMNRFLQTRDDINYTGMDIVPRLIIKHKERYKRFTNWKFVHQDIVAQPLSDTYDIIFCRMMLQHLFTVDVFKVVNHFQESRTPFLLTTTFPGAGAHVDLINAKKGRFRELNLQLPPFSLRMPICMTRDGDVDHGIDHYLALWEMPLKSMSECDPKTLIKPAGAKLDFLVCN